MLFDGAALLPFGRVVDIGSAVVFLVLGVLVALVRPRGRANVAFVLFALSLGATFVVSNLPAVADGGALLALGIVLQPVAVVSLVALAANVAAAPQRSERGALAVAVGLGSIAALVGLALAPRDTAAFGGGWSATAAFLVYSSLMCVGLGGALILLGLRYRTAPDEKARSQLVLTTRALLPFFAANAGVGVVEFLGAPRDIHFWGAYTGPPMFALFLALLGVWSANAARDERPARAARVAVLGAAYGLAAAAFASAAGPANLPRDLGPMGLTRGLAIAVLAYAILKHQLLGIDVKVRWTISKSTVAAVFIAAFFTASEVAQQFFGETLGSTYVGIAAAGALVFAMAPLQRAAERLAEKAVPVATLPRGAPARDASDLYRRAVAFAIRDGRISPDEELHLFELADRLGLSAGEAMRLRQEAERARRAGPD